MAEVAEPLRQVLNMAEYLAETARPRQRPNKPPASWSASDCFPGVQYFFSGRYSQTTEGIENPLPSLNAIHDFSRAGERLCLHVDVRRSLDAAQPDHRHVLQYVSNSQCSRTPPTIRLYFRRPPFNSALLNENQTEFTQYAVLALQRSAPGFDGQLSYFTRYDDSALHSGPDRRLLLNGIASDISRQSYTNGIQGDAPT